MSKKDDDKLHLIGDMYTHLFPEDGPLPPEKIRSYQMSWLRDQRDVLAKQLRNANGRLHEINQMLQRLCELEGGHFYEDEPYCSECGAPDEREPLFDDDYPEEDVCE